MLVTLTRIKEYLGVTGTADDTFLTFWGGVVSDAVEVFCRRKLLLATYEETFYREDYGQVKHLNLWQYPVKQIDSILEGDTDILAECRIAKPYAVLTKIPCMFFAYGAKELIVTYQAGYETLPPVIEMVVLSIIQEKYSKKKAGVDLNFGSDVQRVSIPGTISIDYDYSLTNNDATTFMGNILGNYINVLSAYRSERSVMSLGKVEYVD